MNNTESTCPNCTGSGKSGELILTDGTKFKTTCYMCLGTGTVPEWDYPRLYQMVKNNKRGIGIQTELILTVGKET